jgi:hypothetical protein
MGALRYEKRLQQTAADAAAIAGASNLPFGGVVSGGQNASAANGFTDNGGGQVSNCTSSAVVGTVCVQINNPPASGPHAGNINYVEALVAAVQPTYFMRILGVSRQSVSARAVATNLGGSSNGACLYVLGAPSASIEGVNINGKATLNAPTCGIVDNGNFNTKGNALTVNASTFGISGNWANSGPGGTVTCTASATCPADNMPFAADPLSYLTPPPVGNPTTFNPSNIIPGTYSSISFSGNGTYNFPSGTYVVDGPGGFSCSGTPTITGTDVTFYFTNGATFNCVGNVTVQLSAPTSGTYAGILFYQDPNDTNGPSVGGNSSTNYNGALYFPRSQVTFFGNNSSLDVAIVVTQSIALSGTPTVNLQGSTGLPPGVIENAVLVE